MEKNEIDGTKINMWNLDIQGVELLAMKGGLNALKHVEVIYTEVNEKELYKGCVRLEVLDDFLKNQGFKRVFTRMTQHGWGDAVYINFIK